MGKELFVGSLPGDTNEDEVRNLFSVAGRVVSIRPITDAAGKFNGCAYIRMGSDAEAADAVASLDGALFRTRVITVSVSRTKAERLGSGPQPQPKKQAKKPSRQAKSSGKGRRKN